MLGCYTASFNITAETLDLRRQKSTGKSLFPKTKELFFFMCSQLKNLSEIITNWSPISLLFTNTFVDITISPMNPLLAAIDLLEALPRVIHDYYKKIHCDTNRNKI